MSPTARSQPRTPGSPRRRGVHPLVVAFAAMIVTIAVTYYAFSRTVPFVHKFTLKTLVNNSVNVRADSPVRIAGINVGAVTGVDPGPGSTSLITFTLNDDGLPVHTDATL